MSRIEELITLAEEQQELIKLYSNYAEKAKEIIKLKNEMIDSLNLTINNQKETIAVMISLRTKRV